MRRFVRLLPAAWLLLLLSLPLGAYALGARQADLENRPKTPAPDLNRGTLRQEATFKQLDKAIVDRLPLRKLALDTHGRIAIDVFGDSPNADVLLGDDRWLYYRPELRSCQDEGRPAADPADAVEIVARTLQASGRRAGILVAGSKLVTHTADRPSVGPKLLACVEQLEQRVHRRLATTPGGLDIQAALDRLEQRGVPTFLRSDTHWNAAGRAVFLQAVLDRIRPRLAKEVGLKRGPAIDRDGDLGRFLGFERRDRDETNVAVRTPSAPLPAGDVLLVGDSQMDRALIAPVEAPSVRDRALPGQAFCAWPQVDTGECDDGFRKAKTVITEIVARNLSDFVNVCWRPVVLTSDGLHGRRGRWERIDGGSQPAGALRLEDGEARVRVRTSGADVRKVPRLLRFPVQRLPAAAEGAPPSTVTLTQEPQAGPPSPCGTPAQSVEGGTLVVPVPAGRRASDLVVRVNGPAGTELGAPEEIVLDGASAADAR